jgi:hypothetical protein
MGQVSRINLGSFGPGEDERKAKGLFAAEEAGLQGETPNGLGRNIVAAGEMQQKRMADVLQGRSHSIQGPLPDPAWDAFFGALQDKEQRAGEAGMRFNARPAMRAIGTSPQMDGLYSASRTPTRPGPSTQAEAKQQENDEAYTRRRMSAFVRR